jgi:hypothetical protein
LPRNQAERRLASFASTVTHDTLLAWHRRRLARNASKKRKAAFASGQKHEEIKRTCDRRGRELRARNSTPARSNSYRAVFTRKMTARLLHVTRASKATWPSAVAPLCHFARGRARFSARPAQGNGLEGIPHSSLKHNRCDGLFHHRSVDACRIG